MSGPRHLLPLSATWFLWACTVTSPDAAPPVPSPDPAPTAAAAETPPPDPELAARLEQIDRVIEHKRVELGIPGAALAIVKDGRVVHLRGYGLRDVSRKLPVTPRTQFAIASSSKAFTAATLLMAVDEGLITLDDNPRRCLPYFRLKDPAANEAITVRHLLNHTSGLPRTDLAWITSDGMPPKDVITIAGLAEPVAPLGEKWGYQNVMYTAAGECAARLLGGAWTDVVRDRIFAPLEMTDSNLTQQEMASAPDHALPYQTLRSEDGDVRGVALAELSNIAPAAPAGAINSSAADMARWLTTVMSGGQFAETRLLSHSSAQQWLKPQAEIAPNKSYALGWFVDEWHGKKRVHHGGNLSGYAGMVAMLPEEDIGFVILTNATHGPLRDIAGDVVFSLSLPNDEARTMLDKMVAPPAPQAKDSPGAPQATVPQELLGNYRTADGKKAARVWKDRTGRLTVWATGYMKHRLGPVEGKRMHLDGLPEDYFVDILRDAEGRIQSLAVKFPRGEDQFTPIEAAPPKLPLPKLLTRVRRAHGTQRLDRHGSLALRGTRTYPHEGVDARVFILREKPNRARESVTLHALGRDVGTLEETYDGSAGASRIGKKQPEATSGAALAQQALDATFDALGQMESIYPDIELLRTTERDGEPLFVVEKRSPHGGVQTDYYSQKTYLLAFRETQMELGSTGIAALRVERFSDYRRIEGVMVAHTVEVRTTPGAQVATTRVQSVELGTPIPDGAFSLPSEVPSPAPVPLSDVVVSVR